MIPRNAAYAYVGAFIDELVRSETKHLCVCPGSRSTPLAMCAARHPGMKVWTLIDERSAAFFALGLARGTRAPAAVLSTSGTAAANFLPAVVEARYGRVPLIVLTADRPPEFRDTGANQTIDQVRLYGMHAKWFIDVALPEATPGMLRYVRALAGQAAANAQDAPAGPVHLNFPLREPLTPTGDWERELQQASGAGADEAASRAGADEAAWEGRETGRPYARGHRPRRAPDPGVVAALARELSRAPRGLIVCGPSDDPALPDAVCRLAGALGYPVLADPLSQVRCGPHDRRLVVDVYDALLRVDPLARTLAPDAVLRFGAMPASKPLLTHLEMHGAARHIVVDSGGGWYDPGRFASDFIHADPVPLCEMVREALGRPGAASELKAGEWAALWQRLAARARAALERRLQAIEEPFEGKVFAELAPILPEGAVLFAGNSMPVRDLDSFFPGTAVSIRLLGNRGASGIDGLVSSALGVAASGAGPVVAVLGDLAFYHDMNGLLAAKLHRLKATVILLNNDGGGIFSFLPQAGFREHFEALFGTPHGLEFRHAAEMYGAAYGVAETWEAFRRRVRSGLTAEGLSIVEVRTGRERNVALHREMWAAVAAAVQAEVPALASGAG